MILGLLMASLGINAQRIVTQNPVINVVSQKEHQRRREV